MRCTGCGLPLSPKRTHCPRCGIATGGTGETGKNVMAHSSLAEQSSSQDNPVLLPDPDRILQSSPAQLADWGSASQPAQGGITPGMIRPSEFQPSPRPPQRLLQAHSTRLVQPGFTIAGLCVLAGGLILLLVYIISLNLPPTSLGKQSISATSSTPTQSSSSSLASPTAISTALPTATPTPSFPGQRYIDNAQLASSINFSTVQPSQATTNFKVNQKIFVTFQLHPANNGGAFCLTWYVNQNQFSQFSYAVGALPQNAYSFAYANSTGQGSVKIYWASTTACTDKLLAQSVDFTVTP